MGAVRFGARDLRGFRRAVVERVVMLQFIFMVVVFMLARTAVVNIIVTANAEAARVIRQLCLGAGSKL